MRRVFSLLLLALAFPAAAFAQKVNTFNSGTFQRDAISGSVTNGGSFHISVVGSDSLFSIEIGTLTQVHQGCDPDLGLKACFTFSTGTITVKNTAGSTVLTESLSDGSY